MNGNDGNDDMNKEKYHRRWSNGGSPIGFKEGSKSKFKDK